MLEDESSKSEIQTDIYFYGRTKGRVDYKYRFLSNFYVAAFVINDKEYSTVEHYFQSAKHIGCELEEKIRLAKTPMQAKKLAWSRKACPGWETRKEAVMFRALIAKFGQNPDIAERLLATGDALLHEDSPYDTYWGVKGLDRLGKLLMIARNELRKGTAEVCEHTLLNKEMTNICKYGTVQAVIDNAW